MSTRFDPAVNVLIAFTCLVVSAAGIQHLMQTRGRTAANQRSTTLIPTQLTSGKEITLLPEVRFSAADATVVLFLSSRCRFCADSLDFYRRLSEAKASSKRRVRVVAAGREPAPILDHFLATGGVAIDQVVSTGERPTASSTPTIVIVDRRGIIQGAWIGRLSQEGEMSIVRTIRGL